VLVSPDAVARLSSIRSAMEALSSQGATDSPEARQLVNEYRIATGEAKVNSVIEFIKTLPGLQAPTAAAAAASPSPAAAAAAAGGGVAAAVEEEEEEEDGADSDGGNGTTLGRGRAGSSSRLGGGGGGQQRGKVLVFAHHQNVLDAIQSRLCKAEGRRFIRIDGKSSSTERQVRGTLCASAETNFSVGEGLGGGERGAIKDWWSDGSCVPSRSLQSQWGFGSGLHVSCTFTWPTIEYRQGLCAHTWWGVCIPTACYCHQASVLADMQQQATRSVCRPGCAHLSTPPPPQTRCVLSAPQTPIHTLAPPCS